MNEPGVPGDPNQIQYVVQRLSEIYSGLIDWSLVFSRLETLEDFDHLESLMSKFTENAIKEIEDYSVFVHQEVNKIEQYEQEYEPGTIISLNLSITLPDLGEYEKEFQRIAKLYF